MGIHGEYPPLMKTRKKIFIEEARLLLQKLVDEGWQKNTRDGKKFLYQITFI